MYIYTNPRLWITFIKSVGKNYPQLSTIVDKNSAIKLCAQQNTNIVTGNNCEITRILETYPQYVRLMQTLLSTGFSM